MTDGTLLQIHTAVATGRPMTEQEAVRAIPGLGLEGDRYANSKGKYSRSPGVREVTFFEAEVLVRLKEDYGIDLQPREHRRNLTTEGVVLSHLIGQTFSIGDVTFEGLRPCRPCRYLNLMSKKQVSARLENQAGLFCRVLSEGTLRLGDPIRLEQF